MGFEAPPTDRATTIAAAIRNMSTLSEADALIAK